jgi:hypothetical protein
MNFRIMMHKVTADGGCCLLAAAAIGQKQPFTTYRYNSDVAWIPFQATNMPTGLVPENGIGPGKAAWYVNSMLLSPKPACGALTSIALPRHQALSP